MRLLHWVCLGMLFILSAGCGTARQLAGDKKDDAVIEAIRPTSGVSGEQVTFEARVCTRTGGEPSDLSYEWNFGGGAFPNVSFEEKPTVVLRAGAAAPYNASLKVTGGCLGDNVSVTQAFSLAIEPLSVLAVTGNTGIAGGGGTFSVVVGTGVVTDYAWDFGGAATPSGATGPNPTVTFSGQSGLYNGRVIISNDFEAVEFPFTINVI